MLIECLCVSGGGEGFPPVGRVELARTPASGPSFCPSGGLGGLLTRWATAG